MCLFSFFQKQLNLWPKYVYLIAYIYVMVIPLNAACNPIIYLWRMERMREQSLRVLRRTFSSGNKEMGGSLDPETVQSYVAGTRVSHENLCMAAL